MPFRLEFHVQTDVGIQRQRNEDAFMVAESLGLTVVADGMGGHAGGNIAAQLATKEILESFVEAFECETPPTPEAAKIREPGNRVEDGEFLRRAISRANEAVYTKGNLHEELRDMGTTIVAAWFRGEYIVIGSVGDSRIYRLRNGEFTQITTDHSWVGELLRRNLITEDEAISHPLKNIITRALGMDGKVSVDIIVNDLEAGDLYIMCTDGLTDCVEDREIRTMLNDNLPDLGKANETLVNAANDAAGADNVTIALVRVAGEAD
jgi:serine/threonine protein phosphatase PrpC